MYWDLPPLEKRKTSNSLINKSREEEEEYEQRLDGDEEEKPLMVSQELVGSYGSVVTSSQLRNHTSALSNVTMNHVSPPPSPVTSETQESSSPFRNSSISRGECFTELVQN